MQLTIRVIEAKIITESQIGTKAYILCIVMQVIETEWPFIFKRRQFPVGLYLPRLVFSHGQTYVVLSKTMSHQGLKVLIKDEDARLLY